MSLTSYLRRPDVAQHPWRFLARRLVFETFRALRRLDTQKTVRVMNLFRMRVTLSDTVERSVYLFGAHEFVSLQFFAQVARSGHWIVDIGAHTGVFSLCGSALIGATGRVHAFEPNPESRRKLEQNLRLNECSNVVVHPEALAHTRGAGTLNSPGWAGANTGVFTLVPQPGAAREFEVEITTLDELAKGMSGFRCDIVKIDVEGLELQVLKGARETLAAHKPLIMIEINDLPSHGPLSTSDTTRYLASFGYTLYGMRWTGSQTHLVPISDDQDPSEFREAWQALNLVAMHPENACAPEYVARA